MDAARLREAEEPVPRGRHPLPELLLARRDARGRLPLPVPRHPRHDPLGQVPHAARHLHAELRPVPVQPLRRGRERGHLQAAVQLLRRHVRGDGRLARVGGRTARPTSRSGRRTRPSTGSSSGGGSTACSSMHWPDGKAWSVEGTKISYCQGHDTGDILPFTELFEGHAGPYSNKELVDLMDPTGADSPYIYDNFEWPVTLPRRGLLLRPARADRHPRRQHPLRAPAEGQNLDLRPMHPSKTSSPRRAPSIYATSLCSGAPTRANREEQALAFR